MSGWTKWLGWVVAGVAIIAAGGLFYVFQQRSKEADALREQVKATESDLGELKDQVEQAKSSTDRLEAKMKAIQTPSASSAPPDALRPKPTVTGLKTAPGAPPAVAGTRPTTGDAAVAQSQSAFPFMEMFSGEKGEQMAQMSADMAANMQYGQFLQDLGFPPDAEAQVREILARNLREQILSGVKAIQEGYTPELLAQANQAAQAKLRQELGAVLSPEQMAAFDQYQVELPVRMLYQSLDMQMGMFAQGLAPEARQLALDVIVEELLPTGMATQGAGIPQSLDFQGQLQTQHDALARARERLAVELPPDQMEQVDRFIAQQSQVIDMAAQMMSGSPGQTAQPQPAP